jgi:hypothetical protein
MADASFDFLGEVGIPTINNPSVEAEALKEEEDAFSAAVSVWRGKELLSFYNINRSY